MLSSTMAVRGRRNNRKGQAMIETVFMLPLIVVVIFFIYQAYLVINKVQVVQKYLKGGIIGRVMNRTDFTSDYRCGRTQTVSIPPDGRYFVVYNERGVGHCDAPARDKYATLNIGDTTISMISYFCPQSQKEEIRNFLGNQAVYQGLGVCIGGKQRMGLAVLPDVFNIDETDNICSQM